MHSKRFGFEQDCESNIASKHARKHEERPPRIRDEFRLDSDDFGCTFDGVITVDVYKRNG